MFVPNRVPSDCHLHESATLFCSTDPELVVLIGKSYLWFVFKLGILNCRMWITNRPFCPAKVSLWWMFPSSLILDSVPATWPPHRCDDLQDGSGTCPLVETNTCLQLHIYSIFLEINIPVFRHVNEKKDIHILWQKYNNIVLLKDRASVIL
jgi:hypothetical protein